MYMPHLSVHQSRTRNLDDGYQRAQRPPQATSQVRRRPELNYPWPQQHSAVGRATNVLDESMKGQPIPYRQMTLPIRLNRSSLSRWGQCETNFLDDVLENKRPDERLTFVIAGSDSLTYYLQSLTEWY